MIFESASFHHNSTNSSNSTTEPLRSESLEFKTVKIFFYFLIFVCSTFGNITVAYIIGTTRRMRTPSNYLILNLAICDTLTPMISIPFDFGLEENGYIWCYGGFLCKVLWPASTLTSTASALTLAVIALDRYRLIMHPFKPRLTSKVIRLAIVCVYVLASVVVIPYVIVLRLEEGQCGEGWPSFTYRQGYTLVLFMIQYGLPLPFMVIMYILALKNLYSSTLRTSDMKNQFVKSRQESSVVTADNSNTGRKKLQRKASKYILRKMKENEANKKATIMFIVVVLVFAIFMLPNQIIWLWADFGDGLTRPGFAKATIICWLFTYSNCVFNPVIFTAFSKDFRNGFKKIFTKKCFRQPGRKVSSPNISGYSRPSIHSSNGPTSYVPLDSAAQTIL